MGWVLVFATVLTAVLTTPLQPWAPPTPASGDLIQMPGGASASVSVAATLSVGARPNGIAVDPSTNRVYVTNRDANTVSVIDGHTQRVIATVSVGIAPSAIAVDSAIHRVYVANTESNMVTILDEATDAVVGTIPTGAHPGTIAVDPSNHTLYVGDDGDAAALRQTGNPTGTIRAFDDQTGLVRATQTLGSGPLASMLTVVRGLAVDPIAHRVYATTSRPDNNSIAMLDGGSLGEVGSVGLLHGVSFGVAVDSATHRVYATDPIGDLMVFDGTTPRAFSQQPTFVRVGDNPLGVAVDSTTRTVYVANSGTNTISGGNSNSLSVLDENTNRALATVPVGTTPWAVAVDPSTHLVYVTNQGSDTVSILRGLTQPSSVSHDCRYFPQTGFRIDNDTIWTYFQRRGGVASFGFPTSRTFLFQGFTVQFFQRRVVQLDHRGSPHLLNLLDPPFLPYTSFNGSTFPSVDSSLLSTAPAPTDQPAVLAWVQQHAPDDVNGIPVDFLYRFEDTVSPHSAFPTGGELFLLPGFDLELWGIPTSQPLVDPKNHDFIALRWQRGIMLYDALCGCTQDVLLGDYLKAVLTGQHLPADLAQEAAGSPLLSQYDRSQPHWVRDPHLLPNTDLTNAFTPE
ncbi:MAG: YncE family protein [Chloroflexi bacterium]|nr:YncE family protein [Chloroflexota bacterium]